MKKQIRVENISFNENTDEKVIKVILDLLKTKRRVRIWYGENGASWDDEYDILGYIGRSSGNIKIPLLLNNSRSVCGGAIMTDCIVKIVDTLSKTVLFQHENFSQSNFTSKGCEVLKNGNTYAVCENESEVYRLVEFMNGTRMCK